MRHRTRPSAGTSNSGHRIQLPPPPPLPAELLLLPTPRATGTAGARGCVAGIGVDGGLSGAIGGVLGGGRGSMVAGGMLEGSMTLHIST